MGAKDGPLFLIEGFMITQLHGGKRQHSAAPFSKNKLRCRGQNSGGVVVRITLDNAGLSPCTNCHAVLSFLLLCCAYLPLPVNTAEHPLRA